MIPDFDKPMADGAHQQAPVMTRPQAPVLVIGRDNRFLDVQHTVEHAEEHLTREAQSGVLRLDACDFFDGVARPLHPVITEDGALTLELADGDARPEDVRDRVTGLLEAARESYDPDRLPPNAQIDVEALDPIGDDPSFPRFLDALDRRFNDDGPQRHVAGRLHNFWHAVT